MTKILELSPFLVLLIANVARADLSIFCQYFENGSPTHAHLSFSSAFGSEAKATHGDLQFVGSGLARSSYGRSTSEYEIIVSNSMGIISKLKGSHRGDSSTSWESISTIFIDGKESGELKCSN